jgi:hypothetical protein
MNDITTFKNSFYWCWVYDPEGPGWRYCLIAKSGLTINSVLGGTFFSAIGKTLGSIGAMPFLFYFTLNGTETGRVVHSSTRVGDDGTRKLFDRPYKIVPPDSVHGRKLSFEYDISCPGFITILEGVGLSYVSRRF